MDKATYYIKIQELVDKVKKIKSEIEDSKDNEKIGYLKLAIEITYEEIRQLMERNK